MDFYKTDNDLQDAPENRSPEAGGGRGLGIAAAIAAAVAFGVVLWLMLSLRIGMGIVGPAIMVIGLTQLIWIIPMIVIFRKNKRLMQGVLMGAGFIFLLNASCYAWAIFTFKL